MIGYLSAVPYFRLVPWFQIDFEAFNVCGPLSGRVSDTIDFRDESYLHRSTSGPTPPTPLPQPIPPWISQATTQRLSTPNQKP